jgi:hypothetical protein
MWESSWDYSIKLPVDIVKAIVAYNKGSSIPKTAKPIVAD